MSRISTLWNASPQKVLGALGALSVASLVAVGSGANFTAQTANPSISFTAGNLTHFNSKNGAAILTASLMRPRDRNNGTVDITTTGDIAGVFQVSKSNLVDSTPSMAGKLDLVVEDLGSPASPAAVGSGTVKYTGKISAMGTIALGTFAPAAGHRYNFAVTFPDTGTAGEENAFKGKSTSVQYDWQSTETP